ncbi:MAG: DUF4388 domain-containing protein [Thermoanaerobaculaceae bacterium]
MSASSSQGISGSLQDVAVADVLQFVYLGRRTGLLLLHSGEGRGSVAFVKGRIIFAEATGAPKLGDLLVRRGLLDRRRLEAAIIAQRQSPSPGNLGQILRRSALIQEEQLKAVVEEQIQRAIAVILGWETGEFEFLPEATPPQNEVSISPTDLFPELELDTGALLQQASELFEERARKESIALATPQSPEILTAEDLERLLAKLNHEASKARSVVQVLTSDDGFLVRLSASLREEGWEVKQVTLEQLGGELAVAVLDARNGIVMPADISRVRKTYPQIPTVVVVQAGQPVAPFLRAGAVMVVPAELEAIVLAVNSARRNLDGAAQRRARVGEPALERLRQAFGELRSGFVAASMALNLLRILSESVARAMLLLVKERELVVLGAFGRDARGKLLASSSRGLRFSWAAGDLLQRAAASGEVVRGPHTQLPGVLRDLLGAAARDEVVVFPVRGMQRVLALAVADNGHLDSPIADWEIVELAAEQAGIAFENELLRRKLVEKAPPGQKRY